MPYHRKGRVTLLTPVRRAAQAGVFPPPAPEFPISNYTYAKHCERLRRAAASGAVEVIEAYRPAGTRNTYARAALGYRDLLLEQLQARV